MEVNLLNGKGFFSTTGNQFCELVSKLIPQRLLQIKWFGCYKSQSEPSIPNVQKSLKWTNFLACNLSQIKLKNPHFHLLEKKFKERFKLKNWTSVMGATSKIYIHVV